MCHERYLRRRHREEDEESRLLWQDLERTRFVGDPKPADEKPEPERAEAREDLATSDQ
jgi:hypothetical protein